ncbi:MAG: MFS transporter [Chthonomonas sp.]|nr:MFS transporter [Chthonomonas sp.]
MIIPDIQLLAESQGAPGWLIGAILASTFVIQLFVSPAWGRASDRVGRKPILLICTGFSALGMLIYGVSTSIPLLLLSRLCSGLGGANVAIAQAIIADGTSTEERTAAMGKIGAAITCGLIGGPVLGGFVGKHLGSSWVGFIAASCSALGLLLIWGFLPNPKPAGAAARKTVLFDLRLIRSYPRVRDLVLVSSIAWFALATLEGTFGRLIKATLGFDQSHFGVVFGFESLVGFTVQAYLLAVIAKRLRDGTMLRGAYVLQGLGLGLTPFTYLFPIPGFWLPVLLSFSLLFAVGQGIANPTINSLCSKLTPEDRQGELFGLLQGARSLGFIAGPLIGGVLFDWHPSSPYLLAGCVCVLAAVLVKVDEAELTTSS